MVNARLASIQSNVLLVCLELWTKSEEPVSFVICALLLGTTVTLFHMNPRSSDDAHMLVLQKFGSSLHITITHSTPNGALLLQMELLGIVRIKLSNIYIYILNALNPR